MNMSEVNKLGKFPMSEMFTTFQAEGMNTGDYATFIRFQGCPVECPWCDTAKAIPIGISKTDLSIEQIMQYIELQNPDLVVITGGEPLYQDPDLVADFIEAIIKADYPVQMETSGVGKINDRLEKVLESIFLTLSPKSIVQFRYNKKLNPLAKELKLVVDEHMTLEKIEVLSQYINPKVPIILMAEGWPPTFESRQKALKLFYRTRTESEVLKNSVIKLMDRLQFLFKVL